MMSFCACKGRSKTVVTKDHRHVPSSREPSFENTLQPSRAGDPLISNPTRRREGPFAISAKIRDWPGKGLGESAARRSLPEAIRYALVICWYHQTGALGLTNDPCQAGLDWTDGLVQIMSVQAHASLEAQAVSRSETDQLHHAAGRADELLSDALGGFCRDRDLHNVSFSSLRGIARAS